jgi:flagellar biosynthesis anti-sigma factor FlgM
MKIEVNRPNVEAAQTDRTAAATTPKRTGHTKAAGAKPAADEVRVSSGAQLAANAIAAATQSPDVRPEAVARGRALLAAGKLGTDANKLADALIDSALGKK